MAGLSTKQSSEYNERTCIHGNSRKCAAPQEKRTGVGVKYLREKQIQRVGVDGNEGEVCLVDREAR